MAIGLYAPTAAMHSHDVPGYRYRMDRVWNVPAATSVSFMAGWIHDAATDPEKPVQSLVINCHGSPGYLHLGQGIGRFDLTHFAPLAATKLLFIWIVACEVAGGGAGVAPGGSDGAYFLGQLARTTGTKVIASDRTQYVNTPWVRKNHIDLYEGNVYTYREDGSLSDLGRRKPDWMRLIDRRP